MKYLRLAVLIGLSPLVEALETKADESPVTAMSGTIHPEPSRKSSLSLALDRSSSDVTSFFLGVDFALGAKEEGFRILFDYSRDRFPSGTSSNRTAASWSPGLAYDWSRTLLTSLRFIRLVLPDEVYGRGAELGARYRVGDWSFGTQLRTVRYTSERSLRGRKLREDGIPERSVSLHLGYDLSNDWRLRVFGSRFNYGGSSPSELSDILARDPNVSVGLLGAVEGFPSRSGGVGLEYDFVEAWTIGLAFSRTSYELMPVASSGTLSLDWQVNDSWLFGLAGTSLRQDGVKTGNVLGVLSTFTW